MKLTEIFILFYSDNHYLQIYRMKYIPTFSKYKLLYLLQLDEHLQGWINDSGKYSFVIFRGSRSPWYLFIAK